MSNQLPACIPLRNQNVLVRFTTAILTLTLLFFTSSPLSAKTDTELKKHYFSEPHLGTLVHLVFYSRDEKEAAKLAKQCFQRVRDLNAVFSDYRADSEVSKLCAKPIGQAHKVSDELFTVVSLALKISEKSHGAFDITVGEHTKRWRKQAKDTHTKITHPEKNDVNYQHLKLDNEKKTISLLKPLGIDLGGIAKGYISDQLMLILNQAGIKHAAVMIGGETVLTAAPPGKKGWRIGIENPEKKVIGILILANTCLSTSGDSYQFFETQGKRSSHLIDPKTTRSKNNRLNVTTLAPSAMEADGWATALRVLETEKAIDLANHEAHLKALFMPYKKAPIQTKNFPTLEKLPSK